MQLETGLVEAVRHHREDLLHERQVEALVELVAKLGNLEVLGHLKQQVQARLCDVALGVPKRPHDGVNHQLQLRRLKREERPEAVVGDRPEQREELEPVVGVIFKVRGDHGERALKARLKNLGHLVNHRALNLVDDGGEQGENLGVPRVRHVPRVVAQHRIHHLRHELLGDEMRVFASLHERLNQAEHLALHRSHRLHQTRPGRVGSTLRDGCADELRVQPVHVEHVGVDVGHLVLEGLAE